MKPARLRAWMREYGNLGVLMVATYLGLRHLWSKRARLSVLLVLGPACMLFAVDHPDHPLTRKPAGNALPRSVDVPVWSEDASSAPIGLYALQEKQYGDGDLALRIVNRATGRTVWSYLANSGEHHAWSVDHCALAMIVDRPGLLGTVSTDDDYFRLIIWQAGSPIHYYDHLDALKRLDGIWSLALSPDKQRLVFCGAWCQGMADVAGGIYVLPLPPSRVYFGYWGRIEGLPPDVKRAHSWRQLPTQSGAESVRFTGTRTIEYAADNTLHRIHCP